MGKGKDQFAKEQSGSRKRVAQPPHSLDPNRGADRRMLFDPEYFEAIGGAEPVSMIGDGWSSGPCLNPIDNRALSDFPPKGAQTMPSPNSKSIPKGKFKADGLPARITKRTI